MHARRGPPGQQTHVRVQHTQDVREVLVGHQGLRAKATGGEERARSFAACGGRSVSQSPKLGFRGQLSVIATGPGQPS